MSQRSCRIEKGVRQYQRWSVQRLPNGSVEWVAQRPNYTAALDSVAPYRTAQLERVRAAKLIHEAAR